MIKTEIKVTIIDDENEAGYIRLEWPDNTFSKIWPDTEDNDIYWILQAFLTNPIAEKPSGS